MYYNYLTNHTLASVNNFFLHFEQNDIYSWSDL